MSLVVAIPLAGIVAAIAIPSLLRARVSANEAAAIGDIRTVISAEAAYQSGQRRLLRPAGVPGRARECLPAYSGPTFLDPSLASAAMKSGYRRTFHPGPPCPAAPTGRAAPRGSLESFAYVAVPEKAGPDGGARAFCGDASGPHLRFTRADPAPRAGGARRPPACQDLR